MLINIFQRNYEARARDIRALKYIGLPDDVFKFSVRGVGVCVRKRNEQLRLLLRLVTRSMAMNCVVTSEVVTLSWVFFWTWSHTF